MTHTWARFGFRISQQPGYHLIDAAHLILVIGPNRKESRDYPADNPRRFQPQMVLARSLSPLGPGQ